MNQLFKFEEWLTLEDAANHISIKFGRPVTLAHLYQFSLSGDLKLSANFVNPAKAKKVTLIKKEDIKYKKIVPKGIKDFPQTGGFKVPTNAQHPISRELWVESIEAQVVSLSGVWDLSMIGTEKFSIKQLHQQEISSDIEVKVPEAMSVYVKGAKETYELQLLLTMEQYREQHNTPLVNGMRSKILDCALAYPASRLDELDYVLVVKTKEVTRFIQRLGGTPQEVKPPAQTAYKKNTDKLEQRKVNTQARYQRWQDEADKIQEDNPSKPETWVADKIAKMLIAEGRSSARIRKMINNKERWA
ncbi:hypothetical protein CMT41_03540 [Colwellia sp. MT41]|uniref:hypothetical protein n=1 Tax=Colwellia sp. MT41 TaxID=58049 RepID=UPI00071784B1|nr:hypothetical protein [Colwellia sp. MT41]ALO33901.1 hypothetical protein CMT41_03540 [Colwellia sp. MT41]